MDNELEKVEVIARVTWRRRLAFFAGLHGTMGASTILGRAPEWKQR